MIEPGYYVLREDFKNPAGDRRYKNFYRLPIWNKGTRFRVRHSDKSGLMIMPLGEGTSLNVADMPGIPELLEPVLEKVPDNLGIVYDKTKIEIHDILATLIEGGDISIDMILATAMYLDSDEWVGYQKELAEKQWTDLID